MAIEQPGKPAYKTGITYNPGVHKTVLLGGSSKINGQTKTPWKGSITTGYFNVQTGKPQWSFKKPYGFRFHYNPSNVVVTTAMDDQVVGNQMDIFNQGLKLWQHQQQISFSLLLNRQPDMLETSTKNYVGGSMTATDLANIKKYGTLWDIDFLYHAINGDNMSRDTGWANSDIGFLYPTVVTLNLGPNWATLGFLANLQITHQQFTPNMVPTLTQLDLTLYRMSAAVSVPVDVAVPDAHEQHVAHEAHTKRTSGGSSGTKSSGSPTKKKTPTPPAKKKRPNPIGNPAKPPPVNIAPPPVNIAPPPVNLNPFG